MKRNHEFLSTCHFIELLKADSIPVQGRDVPILPVPTVGPHLPHVIVEVLGGEVVGVHQVSVVLNVGHIHEHTLSIYRLVRLLKILLHEI